MGRAKARRGRMQQRILLQDHFHRATGNKSYNSETVGDCIGDPMWNETVEWNHEETFCRSSALILVSWPDVATWALNVPRILAQG